MIEAKNGIGQGTSYADLARDARKISSPFSKIGQVRRVGQV